jgi:outer membrane protein OmpA-like peptidoglycan-associated protein
MTRSEARTEDAWRSFDRWATIIVPLLMLLAGLGLWQSGYGANARCCTTAPAEPPVAAAPAPARVVPSLVVPTPAAPVVPPVTAEPVIDCNSIVRGVAVPFAVNSAVLTDAGRRALDQAITCLGEGRYEVAGHTDADGDDASNQRLSVARARAAVRYLVSKGVPTSSLSAAGYGESQPVADNATPEGRAKNRRIAFTPKP